MLIRLLILLSVFAAAMGPASPASAHPHVWVTIKTELLYTADGSVSGVRHAWTFDDMFSAFAVQGLPQKTKGAFSREELAGVAEVNITSLKEWDFFTYAKANGAKLAFAALPKDYWLDYKDSVLTLHFTLPLKQPVKAETLVLEVYDPSYFVDFDFAKEDAVALTGAPATCKFSTNKLDPSAMMQNKQLSEAFFNDPNLYNNWGAQFSNRVTVRCP